MTELSNLAQDVLLKIYVGQNIRPEGILQSQTGDAESSMMLLSEGFIRVNHWYNHYLFLTTPKGDSVAKPLIEQRIKERENQLTSELQTIPPKVLSFFTNRYISKDLSFSTEKPIYGSLWEDRLLVDGRIWAFWNKFFNTLDAAGLCFKTHYFVSSRGGQLRDLHYVISAETRNFFKQNDSMSDFTTDEAATLSLYPVLTIAQRILEIDNVIEARQRFYTLLIEKSVREEKLAEIINCMNKEKITSEYRGLNSEAKPFEIINPIGFQAYLYTNLIEKGIIKLMGKGEIQKDSEIEGIKADKTSSKESSLDFIDDLILDKQLGNAYLLVRNFELDIRKFIKDILGEEWLETIEKSLPSLVTEWKRKQKNDHNWGVTPDKDLLSYADIHDYAIVIRRYKEIFIKNNITLAEIETKLKDVANCGRNPIMHSRKLTQDMLATCRSAQNLLRNWMKEIRELQKTA